jgi:O-antigen ligase
MTSQVSPSTHQPPAPSLIWRILGLLAVLALAALATGIAFFYGKQINSEEWPLLVTATGLAVYLAVAVTNLRHGLLLWLATAPFARFVHLDVDLGSGIPNLTLNRIMTGVLLVLLLAQLASRRRRLVPFHWLDLLVVLFVVAAAASVPNALVGLKQAAQSFFDLIGVPVALYFLARNLITNVDDLRALMITLVIIGVYLGVLAIREQLTGQVWFYPQDRSIYYTSSIRRVVGLLGNPAYIAVSIGMGVPWAWYLFLTARRGRLWLLLAIGIMSAGIFFCMNRSGWAGLVIGMFVMALFVPRFRKIFLLLLLIAAIVGGVYWAVIISSTTWRERLQAQGPLDYRAETWEVALDMIRDHPLFGLGYENFSSYYPRYARWDVYLRAVPTPHNTYLWVMLMGGAAAFIPFALMLLVMTVSAWGLHRGTRPLRRERPWADIAGVFMASMASIWGPAFVMDIMTGYFNTMIMFTIIGAFYGVASWEQWRLAIRERRALASEQA